MSITRQNYESFFIDYLDGTLSPDKLRELHTFLLLNDDLAESLEEFSTIPLKAPALEYPNKSLLRKDELHACPDYYAIAAAENTLTETDIAYLRLHPDLENNKSFYQNIKLKPDFQLKYLYKSKLHRPLPIKSLKISAVAAVIIVLIGFILLLSKPNIQETPPLSETFFCPTPAKIEGVIIPKTEKNIQTTQVIKKNAQIKSEKVTPILKENFIKVPLISLPLTRLQVSAPAVTLVQPENLRHRINITQSEIYLAESASIWKASERRFLSDNIVSSVINAGKMLTEKIKTKERNE